MSNNRIVLITGVPNAGKSASLRNWEDQESKVYLNTDMKDLPFRDTFNKNIKIDDAQAILAYITEIEQQESITGVALDTLTFLMSMYERQYVVNSSNTQAAWGNYANHYKDLIHAIKAGTKDYVILAHEDTVLNEKTLSYESKIPIKGSVGKTGAEADFSLILAARKVPIKLLEGHENDLLNITDDEREDGEKRVFMTRPYKGDGDKTRSPLELWSRKELYIDNDVNQVFKRLGEYYS